MERMNKTFLWVAILLIVLTQTGFAQQNQNSKKIETNYILELWETKIWIMDNTGAALMDIGGQVMLYLDETNPTFFALVYNSLKDHLRDKKTMCHVWTTTTQSTNGHGTYAKITQFELR